jgi:hypothetical protein
MRFCRSDQDEAGFFRPNMLVKSLCCSTRMTMPRPKRPEGSAPGVRKIAAGIAAPMNLKKSGCSLDQRGDESTVHEMTAASLVMI